MLIKLALACSLHGWSPFSCSPTHAVHVLLLVGLALLLLGFLRARDEAMRRPLGNNPGEK